MSDDRWSQADSDRVRKDIRDGKSDCWLMILEDPGMLQAGDERGIKVEKGDRPYFEVTLFDYNCPVPWRSSRPLSIGEAKAVAKWLLKRVKEEEPSLPRKAFNAIRNSLGR